LIPNKGPNTGGNLVNIKGKMMMPFQYSQVDFLNTTWVQFGPNRVRVNLINNTHASVIAPASYSEGPVPVEVICL